MCAQNGSPVSEILMQWKSTYSISQNKCSTGGKELERSGSGAASCCRRFRDGGAGRTRVRLSCAGDSADATWVLSKGMQHSLLALLSPVSRHCCCLPAEARLALGVEILQGLKQEGLPCLSCLCSSPQPLGPCSATVHVCCVFLTAAQTSLLFCWCLAGEPWLEEKKIQGQDSKGEEVLLCFLADLPQAAHVPSSGRAEGSN